MHPPLPPGRNEPAGSAPRPRTLAKLKDQPEVQSEVARLVAATYQGLGEYDRAAALLRADVERRRRSEGPRSVAVAESLLQLGDALYDHGRIDDSEAPYQEALGIQRERRGERSAEVADLLWDIAGVRRQQGDLAAAESHPHTLVARYNHALYLLTLGRTLAPSQKNIALDLAWQGAIEAGTGRLVEAERHSRQALAIEDGQGDMGPVIAATIRSVAAAALAQAGRLDEADRHLSQAVAAFRAQRASGSGSAARSARSPTWRGSVATRGGPSTWAGRRSPSCSARPSPAAAAPPRPGLSSRPRSSGAWRTSPPRTLARARSAKPWRQPPTTDEGPGPSSRDPFTSCGD